MKYLIIILLVFGCLKSEGQSSFYTPMVKGYHWGFVGDWYTMVPDDTSDENKIMKGVLSAMPVSDAKITNAPYVDFSPLNIINFKRATDNNDTLFIPAGKYKFLKIGDKIYKIKTTLEEVKIETSHCILEIGWTSLFQK